MVLHKTVLKVDISCEKCKKKVLKAVSSLRGIDRIEIDRAKGTLSVTGDVDPFDVIARCRKAGGFADIVSIGPPPNPHPHPHPQDHQKKPPEHKKPDENKLPHPHPHPHFFAHYPCSCPLCYNNHTHFTSWEEPQPLCIIL